MAITDGPDQSRVAPPPNERSTKNRLLLDCYDSDGSDPDGSDSGVDTNGRQHDDADLEPVSSHEGDIIVDKGQRCEDPASPKSESTGGSERLAPQATRKRKMPSSGQSDSDSTKDSDIRTQRETADGHDNTILTGSACRDNDPGLLLARQPEDLQCIREYRISASDTAGKPYFELECLMQDGQWYWIAESDIQRSVPSAVGTFWGCGPEDWIALKPGEKETGRAYWKRPLATDDDGVPDALLISGRKTTKSGQTQFPMQKVGYPTTPPTWHDEDTVKDEWTQEYERYQLHHANYRDLMNGEEPRFVAVVGHRLNGENGSKKGIQFSCQWTNGTESWEPEDDVQRKYNAAALTYWQSDAKARRACKVPDRRLRIVGHDKSGTKLLLKVQMVGRSSCDMCAICGKLPCQRSSTCRPNVPLEPVGRLLLKWREATEQYLEDQDLTCYNTKSTLKRRSKRLR